MKFTFASVFLLSSFVGWGQFLYTVNDEGGWANVYEKPSFESRVMDSIHFPWVFELDWDSYFAGEEWLEVYIPRTKDIEFIKYHFETTIEGYIHRSRILPIDSMKEYTGEEFVFNWYAKPFDTLSHEIEYDKGSIVSIDGLRPYGNVCLVPKMEVDSTSFLWNGSMHDIPYHIARNIFDDGSRVKVFERSQVYFVLQVIGDGSETYWVIWVFTEHWLLMRYISWGP